MVEANVGIQKTFTPEPTLFANLEKEITGKVEEAGKQLAGDHAVTGIDEYFTCTICLLVVEEPKECQECNQLCCGSCLDEWSKRNQTCPNCRCNLNLGKQVNRFVMQSLNNTEFKCDTCLKTFKYEQRKGHWASCGAVYKCSIEGCFLGGENLPSIKELKDHWNEQCNAIMLQCSICTVQVTRELIGQHSCDQGLIDANKRLKERVAELEQVNAALKEEVAKLKKSGKSHGPTTDKKCRSGHPLLYNSAPFPRMIQNVLQGGNFVNCDSCRSTISVSIGYFRCDSRACDYDLCARCVLSNNPPRPQPDPVMVPTRRVPISCKQGHPVIFFPTGHVKNRITARGMHSYAGDLLNCDGCRQQFSIASRGGFYSCGQPCDFDLCVKCTRCHNGHQMEVQYGNPYAALGNYFICNYCRSHVSVQAMQQGFARCNTCEFDACRNCVPNPR